MKQKDNGKQIKLAMYIVAVILINLVSISMFFRVDLTKGNIYSLSPASVKLVKNLSEPLTINIFFSKNLPAPYNNLERYLQDLMQEYAASGGRQFNYQFYDVSSADETVAKKNQDLAQNYGIMPVQIQNVEHDELKFQKAYMGMALIHGDITETIPAITSTNGLEYKITSTIRKMSKKMSTLLGLGDKIHVRLYLSSSLNVVAPYMNVTNISRLPSEIQRIVTNLNAKNYDKIDFERRDPSLHEEDAQEAENNNIMALDWNAFPDRSGTEINAGEGYIGLLVQHQDRTEIVNLLDVARIPVFGTQYQLRDTTSISKAVERAVENIIDVNEEIGYLADHGTNSLGLGGQIPGMPDNSDMNNFNKLLSEQYSIQRVTLKDKRIPEGLPSLIIAGPKEHFSDYELYQIDQFLMKGKNVAVFLDSFKGVMPQHQNRLQAMLQRQEPVYQPLDTGLQKLLAHYGVLVEKSIVMDDNSYKQKLHLSHGGGEQPVYFAPIIKKENISKEFPFLENIKGLVMFKTSPVSVDEDSLKANGVKAYKLLSSSDKAWEMKGRINFNPMLTSKPNTESAFKQMPLAYLLEGSFTSYFAGKPIPEKPQSQNTGKDVTSQKARKVDTSEVESDSVTTKKGKPGKLFVIGSSEILKDNILDESGDSPNSQFVLNVLDYLNGREGYAVMRSKTQSFNPLDDISPGTKAFIKGFNIAGLPVLVVVVGIVVWIRRTMRKRLIKQMFTD